MQKSFYNVLYRMKMLFLIATLVIISFPGHQASADDEPGQAVNYSISFDLNGATGTAPSTFMVTGGQASAALPDSAGITPPSGKVFGGWNVQADGHGTNYAAGDVISDATADLTLYARWRSTVTKAYITGYTNNVPSVVDVGNLSSMRLEEPIRIGGEPYGVAFSPKGNHVLITDSIENKVSVIDPIYDTVLSTINVGTRPIGVVFNGDGSKAYISNSEDGTLSVINTSTYKVTKTITLPGDGVNTQQNLYPTEMVVVGGKLYVIYSKSNKVAVVDTATDMAVSGLIQVGGYPTDIAVNPAGTKLYVASFSSTVSVIDVTNSTVQNIYPVGYSPTSIAVSTDGKKIYVGNRQQQQFGETHYDILVINAETNIKMKSEFMPFYFLQPYDILMSKDGDVAYVLDQQSLYELNTQTDSFGAPFVKGFTRLTNATQHRVSIFTVPAREYTVTLDSQGGSAAAPIRYVADGGTITAPSEPTREGFNFAGWYKEPTTTNAWNFATDTVTSNKTLYAKWTKLIPVYTVSFDVNGGSGTAPASLSVVESKNTSALPDGTGITPPSGKVFAGWNTQSEGQGASYASGAILPNVKANVTLYAKWLSVYTISFDLNGGTGSLPAPLTVNDRQSSPALPANTGMIAPISKVFGGWNTQADGQGTSYAVGAILPNVMANMTLFAVWEAERDTTPPKATAFSPTFDARNVPQNTALTVTFNEDVKAVAGKKIWLYTPEILCERGCAYTGRGILVEEFDASDTRKVNVSGSTVTIHPSKKLGTPYMGGGSSGGDYYVSIEGDAFRDMAENSYAGFHESSVTSGYYTRWYFTTETEPDTVAPKVTAFSPVDGATNVALNSNLLLTFNEAVTASTYNVVIMKASDNTIVETITANDTSKITIIYNTVVINPTADFMSNTDYYVLIKTGAFKDFAGNSYAGIADSSTWNFRTDTTVTGTYTVTFNTAGGSSVAPIQQVSSGTSISAPASPTRAGYVFAGWFKDVNGSVAWTFAADKVTSNVTLYAKWNPESTGPSAPAFSPAPVPQPCGNVGTTCVPNVPVAGGNRLLVKVSSSIIATPNTGDPAPTGAGIMDPYVAGSEIPGVDPVTNRFIGLYEVDSTNKVVRFTLITLTSQHIQTMNNGPKVSIYSPVNGEIHVALDKVLTLTFDKNVTAVHGKRIWIKKQIDDSIIRTIMSDDYSSVGVLGNRVQMSPYLLVSDYGNYLGNNTAYYVQIEAGAFKDATNAEFAGISNKSVWSFTTRERLPVPGFSPTAEPEPGRNPGTTSIPDVKTVPGNHLRVKVSLVIIETPNVGEVAPSGTGIINPYTAGADIPGVDAKVNRYVGLYEVDSTGKVVKFRLIVLNEEDVKPTLPPMPQPTPVPGFRPTPVPVPGMNTGTTSLPEVLTEAGNHLRVKVSTSIIGTPLVGDNAPSGTGVINPYAAGADIPGVDAKVNRYVGLYEVNPTGKVVKFRLIVLNEEDVKPTLPPTPQPTPVPVPGFKPTPVPVPGMNPGTTGLPDVLPEAGNHLRVKVSTSIIETPNLGDDALSGTGVIDPYIAGADIPGVDANVNRYVGLYEVDSTGKVVKFRLIVLNEEDVKPTLIPTPQPTPVPGFTPVPVPAPTPGTVTGTTYIPNVMPDTGDHLVVKVSSSIIGTPMVGDNAPKGTGVINPYTAGDDIPDVDAKVNRYVGLYEVDATGKVVKFRLIVLNEEDVKPTLPPIPQPTPVPVPGFRPAPVPVPGTNPGTTGLPDVLTEAGNHLRVKVSTSIIETPNLGDDAPSGTGVIVPYTAGADIPGVDANGNRYVGLYEVDSRGKVVKFRLILLNEEDVKLALPVRPVPGFRPTPVPVPGMNPGTTSLPEVLTEAGNHLRVKVSTSIIDTPNLGDDAPRGIGVIDPYTAGTDILGVDAQVNRYIGLYEVDSAGKVVKFRLILLNGEDISPISEQLQQDRDVLTIEYQNGDDQNHVTRTLYLPAKGQSGLSTITWTTSHDASIQNNGRVVRPGLDEQDQIVTLTATIRDATGATTTKDFVVKVVKLSDEDAVREAAKYLTVNNGFDFAQGDTWESVTLDFLMLGQGLYGTSITWSSADGSTIGMTAHNGQQVAVVHRPQSRDKHVVITATISRGNASVTKTFLMVVNNLTVTKVDSETRQTTSRTAEAVVNTDGTPSRNEFTILRTKLSDGTQIDTVIMDPMKVELLSDSFNPNDSLEANRTVELKISQPSNDHTDEIAVEIPSRAITALADRNALLVIQTDEGSIKLNSLTLKQLSDQGTDLYFRLVPVKNSTEQTEAAIALNRDALVQQAASGQSLRLIGIPRKIETNLTGSATKVILPLNPTLLQGYNPSTLRVFVEHTDGGTELLSGDIVYENGAPIGIEIEINRFSRFQVIALLQSNNSTSDDTRLLAQVFSPAVKLEAGVKGETTSIKSVSVQAGNRIVVRISDTLISSPYVGDAVPVEGNRIDPYVIGSDISGVDLKKYRYVAVYEVDSNNRIVRFQLLTAASGQISPSSDPKDLPVEKHMAYMQGYQDGSFKPDGAITRAEMATVLSRVINKEERVSGIAYLDLDRSHWAIAAVEKVTKLGMMNGYTDGSFMPQQSITRAEMAAIIVRIIGGTVHNERSSFSDSNDHWAQAAIMQVQAAGIMQGYVDGTFRPDQALTRAEAVTVINKLLNRGPLLGAKQQWKDVLDQHWAFNEIQEASIDHAFKRNESGKETYMP